MTNEPPKQPLESTGSETATGQSMPAEKQRKLPSIKLWIMLLPLLLVTCCVAGNIYARWDHSFNRWYRWTEEVQLSNGEVIWVNRSSRYYQWSAAFGNAGGSRNEVSAIGFDTTKTPLDIPEWHFDVATPVLLDFDLEKNRWFVVTTFAMCREWAAWGHPMPPYRLYELHGREWLLVPFDEKLIFFRSEVYILDRVNAEEVWESAIDMGHILHNIQCR